MRRVIFSLSFFMILLLPALYVFFVEPKTFSESENRMLAQVPQIGMDEVLEGRFQEGISDFLIDQFPLRERLIKLNTAIRKVTGNREINGVYLGNDHYYFCRFTDADYSLSRAVSIFQMIEAFADHQSVPVTVMPVPSPGTVLSDKLPGDAPYYDAQFVYEEARQQLSCPVIDLRGVFAACGTDAQLYYRTDHHWTTKGAYLAYQEYCKSMEMIPGEYDLTAVSDSFYGTVYSRLLDAAAIPDSVEAPMTLPELTVIIDDNKVQNSLFVEECLEKKDKYAFFLGGNWGKVKIQTSVENQKKLLVIKDSFANCFVPFLVGDYEEIVMVDLRYYDESVEKLIRESGSTEILVLYELSNLLTDKGILKLAES